jgi:hypothetical protein
MKFIGVSAVLVFVSSFVWVLLRGSVATSSIMITDPIQGWALNLFVSLGVSLLLTSLAVTLFVAIRTSWLELEVDRENSRHLQDEFGLSLEDANAAIKMSKEQAKAKADQEHAKKISDATEYLNKSFS